MTMTMTMSIQSASPPFVGQRCRWGKQNNHATLEPPVTVLVLTACGGGGGGSPSLPTSQPISSANQPNLPPGAPLVSEQHFHYNLNRAGEVPITQTGSRESAWTTSDLRQLDGTEDTGARDDFNTVAGSLADNSTFTRYGF